MTNTIFLFAHGAGAPMDSPFMNTIAEGLADHCHVVRFEFPYMQERRQTWKKRPPNSQSVLLDTWREQIEKHSDAKNLWIGGKSMGGRMASLIADEYPVKGLICLGYPFYAPGKKDKPRIEHLQTLQTRTLILQGERDSMGSKEEVLQYSLSDHITFDWLPDGDHSFKPRKASGFTEEQNLQQAIQRIQEEMS